MRIKQIIIENFRAYKSKTIINIDELTVFIGKNDVGKSTILEALDIFINDKDAVTKIDKDDVSKNSEMDEIKIGVLFSEFPKEVDIDGGNPTSLEKEFLLNQDGDLELFKTYKDGKCTSKYIYAYHPTHELAKDLLLKKRTELKKVIEHNSSIECSDKTRNSVMRESIRKFCGDDLNRSMTEVKSDKEDAKKIFEKIETYFPIYALFQSDRANKDQDNEIQDPMKLAIKETLADEELKKQLESITNEVKKASADIAQRTLKKLNEINPEIANDLKPRIPSFDKLKWEKAFEKIVIESDDGIPLNKRGSGVRRLVLLSFFRAQAEKNKTSKSKSRIIYAFEEPETSQHPDHQQILTESFLELVESGSQVLLTTHSPNLAQLIPAENLRFLSKSNGEDSVYIQGINDGIVEVVEDLGILPNLTSIVVCVEGKRDELFLKTINKNIPDLKNIFDLSLVSFIPLKGGNLKDWNKRNALKNSSVIEFHIYDKDHDNKYEEEVRKVNERSDKSSARLTKKREMENYIPQKLVCDHYKISYSGDDWGNENISQFVFDNLNPNYQGSDKERNSKIKEIKNCLSSEISKKMTRDNLEEDSFTEIKEWLNELKKLQSSLVGIDIMEKKEVLTF